MFVDGTIPAAFKVTESTVCPSGVILVNYERAGAITPSTVERQADLDSRKRRSIPNPHVL